MLKKEQVRRQFGHGHGAEDHGGTGYSRMFYPQKGNKQVKNYYSVFYSSCTDQMYPINYTIEGDSSIGPKKKCAQLILFILAAILGQKRGISDLLSN